MRVVLVVQRFPAASQTFIVRKLVGLRRAGVDVHVVCRDVDPGAWPAHPDLGAMPDLRDRVHRTRIGRSPVRVVRAVVALAVAAASRPGPTLRHVGRVLGQHSAGALRQLLLDAPLLGLRPDIVHVEFGSEAVGHEHLRAATGSALTVSFRGFDANYVGLEDPAFFDCLWSTVDGVHVLGADLLRRIRARGLPDGVPVAIIPPSVDTRRFSPGPSRPPRRADEPFHVLSVGRLHWKKGYPDGLAAIRRLVDAGVPVRYRIVGDGRARDEVEHAIRALGLGSVVELRGLVPSAAMPDELRWADVLLHPAVSEGFANAVLEAQATGVPVVCTDADGLPDNVVHGETVFVVPRRDPVAMAERLLELALDPDLGASLGAAGRRRAVGSFTLERESAAFERSFAERVAAARRSSAES
jgi:colanic acid/amylovoran biosynthesis glycosyltransferase